jgi:predicted amidohydrolase
MSLEFHRDLMTQVRAAADKGAKVIVLPENALGHLTPTLDSLWREQVTSIDVTIVAGATVVDGQGYDNVMVAIAGDAEVAYRQRMPVPVSMWQPWRAWGGGGGAQAYLLENPTVAVDGMLVAPLLCYEQLLVWPVLQSVMGSPDVIVAAANVWWADGTSIVPIQRASTVAWARLFSKALVMAFNR